MATEPAITWWAIVSAFGGTIIGGLISYFLQRVNLVASRKQREEDRLRIRQALAYSLLFKLITIVSRLHHIQRAIAEMFDEAKANNFKGQPWNIMRPIVPIPLPLDFQAEEMALVLSVDDKAFNEIASLDQIHNSTIAVLQIYNSKREAVLVRFGAEMMGNIGTTKLTKEQADWLGPRAVELNDIAKSIITRISLDADSAKRGLKMVHAALEKELKLQKKIDFLDRNESSDRP